MLMAGRGKRLDVGDQPKTIGILSTSTPDKAADLSLLTEKINQINVKDVNFASLMNIRDLFNQLCSSKETMRNLLNDLHSQALLDADFGEKLVICLEQMSNLEVNGVLLRGELLTLIQKDFEMKETLQKSDKKKFLNSVMLLGGVFNKVKVCGAPIAILGIAMVEYFDLLMKGGEEELKTLTVQILINGMALKEVPAFEEFKVKLREHLLNASSNNTSKCWILLIIDLISNDLRILQGPIHEFYVSNLKDNYVKLESLVSIEGNSLNHSPQNIKPPDSIAPRSYQSASSAHTGDGIKKDLTKKFSDMTVKIDGPSFKVKKDKGQISPGKNIKRDNWRQNPSKEGGVHEHDDRFDKDEDYYGVQKPRQPRSEGRKFFSDKNKKKEISETKTSPAKTKDMKDANFERNNWN